jgi:urease accessory protein
LKPLTIVEQVYEASRLPAEFIAFPRDTLTLGWEDRLQAHGRRRSDGGVEFATSLPRGTVLRAGHCLVLEADRLVVTIVERAEPVFIIEPRSRFDLAMFAYHIGNRHQPMMVIDQALVCPDRPGVEQLLQQHQMPFSRATLPFTPASTIAAASGHHH